MTFKTKERNRLKRKEAREKVRLLRRIVEILKIMPPTEFPVAEYIMDRYDISSLDPAILRRLDYIFYRHLEDLENFEKEYGL